MFKLIFALVAVIICGSIGYNLGVDSQREVVKAKEQKTIEWVDKNADVAPKIPSSAPKVDVPAPKAKAVAPSKKRAYLEEHLKNPTNKKVYNQMRRIFDGIAKRDDIALWITLGTTGENGDEYTALMNDSQDSINESPDVVYDAIKERIEKLDKTDSFERGMLNNLVHNLEIDKRKKVAFFGGELNREIGLEKSGGLDESSQSVIQSLILMRQSAENDAEVEIHLRKALESNSDPKVQEALKLRFRSYFPTVVDNL